MRPAILVTTTTLLLTLGGSAIAHSPWSAPYPVAAHYRPLPPPPPPRSWYARDRQHCPPPVAWRAPPRWAPPVSSSCWTARGVAYLPRPQPLGSPCSAVTTWGAIDRGIVR
jgi:hypothetical protein